MKPPPEELQPGTEAKAPKQTREEQVRQVVQQYIDDLRQFLRKLRERMH